MQYATRTLKILIANLLLCLSSASANSLRSELDALKKQARDIQVKLPEKEQWQYPPKPKKTATQSDSVSLRQAAPQREKTPSRDKEASELLNELEKRQNSRPNFDKIWGDSPKKESFRRRSR